MAAWFATTNAYIFRVDNWDPFGTLNLSNLIIKASPTSNTGMELSGYKIRIKTEDGQLNVHKICDEDGDNCSSAAAIYNITNWAWAWNGISADWTTWNYCFRDDDWNLMCDNTKLNTIVAAIIAWMELGTPKNGTLTITQWDNKRYFSANTGENVEVNLAGWWDWTRQPNTKDQAGYVATWWTNLEGRVRKVDNDWNPKWLADDTSSFQLQAATGNNLWGIKIGYELTDKNYPVELDSNNKAYVHVPRYPWEGWWWSLNVEWNYWKRCKYMCRLIDIGEWWTEIDFNTAEEALKNNSNATYSWCYISCKENEPSWWESNWNKNTSTNTITPKGISTNVNVNWNFIANPGNTDAYKNIPEVVINTTGVRMFWGINYYRYTTVDGQQKKMRWLSVNWPILAWTSGNYIYMYANWSSSGDQFRSYEIMWNNELAVGTRAGAFLYFTERTGKYAQVITWWWWNWTNTRSAQTGVPVNSCPDDRWTQVSLPNLNWWSSECTTVNITIPEKTARNYINPTNVGIGSNQTPSVYKSLMVWVNTNDPQATLDVNGSIRVGSNCVPIGMTCDSSTVWTMMYLERKNTYRWSIVVCIADGVTLAGNIKYKWYDIMNDIKWESLTWDLWFAESDWSCLLPKPNRWPYPVSPEQYES